MITQIYVSIWDLFNFAVQPIHGRQKLIKFSYKRYSNATKDSKTVFIFYCLPSLENFRHILVFQNRYLLSNEITSHPHS